MSGIAGICDFDGNIDKKVLRDMINIIAHRGRDSLNIFIDDNVALAHCLLSFNGEKTKRPITNETSSILVVLDGLIYNYTQLKAILEKKHKFYSNAEEEVITHLYEEYGIDFVKMIDGDFAFALWNSDKRELVLARDGIGVKPLFYALVDNKLLFASEIKSLLVSGIKKEVDLESFYGYINYIEFPGSSTLFKGIKKLPPGCLIVYNKKSLKLHKYWDVRFNPKVKLSEEAIIRKLSELLKESILKRLKFHSFGVTLSGGLDSAAITALIKDIETDVDTYTIDCNRPASEFERAREIASFFSTNHHEFVIEPEHIHLLPKAMWYVENSRLIPVTNLFHYLLSEIAKNKKILFAGYGTDALFGNSLFTWVRRTEFLRKIPHTIRSKVSFLAKFLPLKVQPFIFSGGKGIFTHVSRFYFTENEKKTIFRHTYENENLRLLNKFSKDLLEIYNCSMLRDLELSLIYSLNTVCNAHLQEAAFPFLDIKIVNFTCRIPFEIRLKGDKSKKYLLKKCMEGKLPKETLKRKKIIPVHEYLEKEWFREHRDILQHFILKLSEREYFRKDGIMRLLENAERNYENLWMLIGFELWHEIFIDRERIKAPKSLKEFL